MHRIYEYNSLPHKLLVLRTNPVSSSEGQPGNGVRVVDLLYSHDVGCGPNVQTQVVFLRAFHDLLEQEV